MLEYLFFNEVFAKKFSRYLQSKNTEFIKQSEDVQNATLIMVSEEIEESVWDAIDNVYDDLAEQDQLLVQTKLDNDSQLNIAGIYIQLKGGQQTIAQINPNVMNRMLDNISMNEFNDFIGAIVTSVETPDETAFCQR